MTASLADDKPSPAVAQAAAYYLGIAYGKDGQGDKAAESLAKIAAGPAGDNPAAADARYMLGLADFEAARYDKAIPALEQYLEAQPKGDVADHALARIALAQAALGQADAADATLAKLVAGFPRSSTLTPTRLRLAEVALENKQFDRAAPLFRSLADAKGGDPAVAARAWSGLGWSLLGSNQPAEAARALGTAIDLAPDGPQANDARFARARALEDAKQPAEALAAYAAAIQGQPDAAAAGPAALALARLQVEAKQPGDAAKTYATVVDKYAATAGEPADAVLAEWGWALVDAGQPAEADAVFGRLLKDHPESPGPTTPASTSPSRPTPRTTLTGPSPSSSPGRPRRDGAARPDRAGALPGWPGRGRPPRLVRRRRGPRPPPGGLRRRAVRPRGAVLAR